jgi:hypothetical protein
MEFLPANSEPDSPIDAVRVNWYYRPKDIQRRVQDTRVVFASMHSDTCPLNSLRGKCNIQHLSEIPDLDKYRVQKDCFWFDKLYDRYMVRYYEVVPTSKIVNVPEHVKKVLDERWKFILIEIGRGKELTSAVKTCHRCRKYAGSHESVDCAVCKNTYHMGCIRPPLTRKPARGFAWACAACSRAAELRLEARHTPGLTDETEAADEELPEEDEIDVIMQNDDTRDNSTAPEAHLPPTEQQIHQANLWPYRYLGIHASVEDALDYDDRIYPRASSRLGPRHQAQVNVWHGRPIELVKPAESKKKYQKNMSQKKDGKAAKDAAAAIEAEKENKQKRPKWVVDEPIGYIPRGEDTVVEIKGKKEFTAQIIFRMPPPGQFSDRGQGSTDAPDNREEIIDEYMKRVKLIAPTYNVLDCSTDFLTQAVQKLQDSDYDVEKALAAMKGLHIRSDLKQPDLNREEVKRFEEGVAKYGSELHNVARHVGANFKESRIVRFYYMWKKTDRGRQVWGNYEGRKSKKESKRLEKDGIAASKLLDDVADDADDSAFDNEKAAEKKRGFECKFCATRSSRQWRRAPGTAPGTLIPRDSSSKKDTKDKSNWLTLSLCGRCAYLWRRYAIQYESIEEVSKKIAAAGGRASKRRIDEELMNCILEAQHESGDTISANTAAVAASAGVEVPSTIIQTMEPAKKKMKTDKEPLTATPEIVPEKKKERLPELPLVAEIPRVKIHPCSVCYVIDNAGDDLLKCLDCRLPVHRSCYGIPPEVPSRNWYCDMCKNDHNTQVSTTYKCILCPVDYTPHDLFEPIKVTHKKKTERDREKERLDREKMAEVLRKWRQDQEAAGRPVAPREPLKRTAWNNWVHVHCALWTKEIKFGSAEILDNAEGVGFIPRERFEQKCRVLDCVATGLPTVKCHFQGCNNYVHVGCAHRAAYRFGIDISVVKGTRRDALSIIKLDKETGVPTAAIWCPNHPVTSYEHSMLEPTEDGLTALQLFARTCKQVDGSVTGTVRRAAQFVRVQEPAVPPLPIGHPRNSTTNGNQLGERANRSTSVASNRSADDTHAHHVASPSEMTSSRVDSGKGKICCNCAVTTSPKWHTAVRPLKESSTAPAAVNDVPVSSVSGGAAETTNREPTIPDTIMNGASSTQPQTELPHVNGIVKAEHSSSPRIGNGDAVDTKGIIVWQCHQCHKKNLTPPIGSPEVRCRKEERPPETQYALSNILHGPPSHDPLFWQAPPGAYPGPPPPPFYRPPSQADGPPAHSHPGLGAAPQQPHPGQQVPWPPAPLHHSPQIHSSPWPPPPQRSESSASNGIMAQAQQYGHPIPPPPPSHYPDSFGNRSAYSSAYPNIAPPISRPHSSSMSAQSPHLNHSSNGNAYGPLPSPANYPPSPRQGPYGRPPADQPSPQMRPQVSAPRSSYPGPGESYQSIGQNPAPSRQVSMTASPQLAASRQGMYAQLPGAAPAMSEQQAAALQGYGEQRRQSIDMLRPETPNDGQIQRNQGSGQDGQMRGFMPGASASPNLRNLLD